MYRESKLGKTYSETKAMFRSALILVILSLPNRCRIVSRGGLVPRTSSSGIVIGCLIQTLDVFDQEFSDLAKRRMPENGDYRISIIIALRLTQCFAFAPFFLGNMNNCYKMSRI
ncbi:hypothetical protein DBV15_04962 [Temnothorax longispinosus]|uniref:Uncharacterized protein n=1 Tax=Temnothorax longispinosus TaxID=300112 RepID=A0A4V3SB67_9HYME|nr:hypothetical protein DBV15_04962 [Temnothorax longispinosus]